MTSTRTSVFFGITVGLLSLILMVNPSYAQEVELPNQEQLSEDANQFVQDTFDSIGIKADQEEINDQANEIIDDTSESLGLGESDEASNDNNEENLVSLDEVTTEEKGEGTSSTQLTDSQLEDYPILNNALDINSALSEVKNPSYDVNQVVTNSLSTSNASVSTATSGISSNVQSAVSTTTKALDSVPSFSLPSVNVNQ